MEANPSMSVSRSLNSLPFSVHRQDPPHICMRPMNSPAAAGRIGRATKAGIQSTKTSFNPPSSLEHSGKPETTELTECEAEGHRLIVYIFEDGGCQGVETGVWEGEENLAGSMGGVQGF